MSDIKSDEYNKYLRLYSEGGFVDIRNQPSRANGYWIPLQDFNKIIADKDALLVEAKNTMSGFCEQSGVDLDDVHEWLSKYKAHKNEN